MTRQDKTSQDKPRQAKTIEEKEKTNGADDGGGSHDTQKESQSKSKHDFPQEPVLLTNIPM